MLQESTLNRGRAIINFTEKYCDNRQKILSSFAFQRVVKSFTEKIKIDDQIIYNFFINEYKTDDELISSLIEVIKLLTVCTIEELVEVNNKFAFSSKIKIYSSSL